MREDRLHSFLKTRSFPTSSGRRAQTQKEQLTEAASLPQGLAFVAVSLAGTPALEKRSHLPSCLGTTCLMVPWQRGRTMQMQRLSLKSSLDDVLRGREGAEVGERETSTGAPQTRDNWGSNPQPLGVRDDAPNQPSHLPGSRFTFETSTTTRSKPNSLKSYTYFNLKSGLSSNLL